MKKRRRKKLIGRKSPNLARYLANKENSACFDHAYLMELEYNKMLDMRLYFKKRLYAVDEVYDRILTTLDRTILLFEIAFDKNKPFNDQYVNANTCQNKFLAEIYNEAADEEQEREIGSHTVLLNKKRIFAEEVWREKARHLYYKARDLYTELWWD